LPDFLRRVAALTLVAVVAIGLSVALTYATEPTDATEAQALIAAAESAPIAARGTLSQRDLLEVRSGADAPDVVPVEKLATRSLPHPVTAPMEASLLAVPTPPPTPAPTPAPVAVAAAPVVVPAAQPVLAPPPAPVAVAPPPPAPIAPPPPIAPFVVDEAVWDRLAQCESSGNWAINTGNGYYGGLQFDLSTWQAYGGSAFAAYPHQATREQQIAVAERLYAARGFQPWPGCRAKLGLP
jgi:hypothetical protein